MGVKNFIRKLDIFGKPVQLRLEKKKTHKTLCGGIMTLFIIISLSVITSYYSEKLIYKGDPGVDMISTINPTQSIDISTHKLGFAINILNINFDDKNTISQEHSINQLIYCDKSTTMINKGLSVKVYYSSRFQKAQFEFDEDRIEIPLVPCSDNTYFHQYWDDIFDLPENRKGEFLCPQFEGALSEEIEISGDITSKSAKYLHIQVNVQESIMQQDNWQDIINNSMMIVKVYDQMASLESYSNPIQTLSRTITEWIDFDVKKFIELQYTQEVVSTDKGLYFSDQIEEELQKISDILHFQQRTHKSNYQVINIFTSVCQTKTLYQRNYFKATVMLAYIGGFLQLTLLFGKFITKPFAKLSFYASFVNEVFQFEDEKDKPDQKLNETEQRPLQINQTTVVDETANRTLNQSNFSPQRSIFFPNPPKSSLDMITDMNQTQHDTSATTHIPNRKSNLTRASQLNSKNNDDDYFRKQHISESKKNSVNMISPQITELNTPITIKKKSLYKNQALLSNFRQYFEADRLEKRLIINIKSIVMEFFRKMWYILTYICSKNRLQKIQSSTLQKLKFSKQKVTERLDIIYIVQKLQEIDKLKQIVLNKNQRKLFEYLPRPVLKNDIIFSEKQTNQKQKQQKSSEWSILKDDESIQQKAIKAWIAFIDITNKDSLDKNDKKVIKLLDIKAKNIFEITSKKISDQLQEQLLQNSSKLKLQSCSLPSNQINDSMNNSKNTIHVGQRKSKNLYQFNIQTSSKRNSTTKGMKQRLTLKDQSCLDIGLISQNNLDQDSKPNELNDDKIQNIKMIQKQSESPSQQSSHSSSDSSFSSSESSSSSGSSYVSETSCQQKDATQQTMNKQPRSSKFNDSQKLNNLKIALNEIPENIEKSLRYSQDQSANKSSNQQSTPLNDFSSIPVKKCPALQMDFNKSIEPTPTGALKKQKQNRSLSDNRGSQTEKHKDKQFKNQFIKYFDEVKNQDQLEVEDIKKKNQKFHSNINLSQCIHNINNSINPQIIEKLAPKTPSYNIPPDNVQDQVIQKIDEEPIQFAENKFLSRRKNQMINNKKISTPQTVSKRKNTNSNINDQNEIYNSASFTQFLKKITPIIIQNNFDKTSKNNNNNNNNNNQS